MFRLLTTLLFLVVSLVILIAHYLDLFDYLTWARFLESDQHLTQKIENIDRAVETAFDELALDSDWITRKSFEVKSGKFEWTQNYKRVLIPKDLPLPLVNCVITSVIKDSGGTIFRCKESRKGLQITLLCGYRDIVVDSLEFIVRENLIRNKGKIAFIVHPCDEDGNFFFPEQNLIPTKVAISLLPGVPPVSEIANTFEKKGYELFISLQLSLESDETSLNPYVIKEEMEQTAIREVMQKINQQIPHAIGVIYIGDSLATENSAFMRRVAVELKHKKFSFLDMLSSDIGVAYEVCSKLGIPSLQRDVIITSEDSDEIFSTRITELAMQAQKKGRAVGVIWQPDVRVIEKFEKEITRLVYKGFNIVPLSELFNN